MTTRSSEKLFFGSDIKAKVKINCNASKDFLLMPQCQNWIQLWLKQQLYNTMNGY